MSSHFCVKCEMPARGTESVEIQIDGRYYLFCSLLCLFQWIRTTFGDQMQVQALKKYGAKLKLSEL